MNFILGLIIGAIAGIVSTYFVLRNPKNDKLKAKVDKVGDVVDDVYDKVTKK